MAANLSLRMPSCPSNTEMHHNQSLRCPLIGWVTTWEDLLGLHMAQQSPLFWCNIKENADRRESENMPSGSI